VGEMARVVTLESANSVEKGRYAPCNFRLVGMLSSSNGRLHISSEFSSATVVGILCAGAGLEYSAQIAQFGGQP
jgi:hypothetical protein